MCEAFHRMMLRLLGGCEGGSDVSVRRAEEKVSREELFSEEEAEAPADHGQASIRQRGFIHLCTCR